MDGTLTVESVSGMQVKDLIAALGYRGLDSTKAKKSILQVQSMCGGWGGPVKCCNCANRIVRLCDNQSPHCFREACESYHINACLNFN